MWRLGPQQLESHLPWLLQPQFNGTLKTWVHFIQTTTYVALGELLTVSYSRPQASQVVPVVKNWPANAGDVRYAGLIPGSGKSPGVGNGNPLQYSCLGNPMHRGAWRDTDHRIAQSDTTEATPHAHTHSNPQMLCL